MITHRVFDGREQAVVSVEANDVPRINDGAALDAALEQLLDFRDAFERLGQFSVFDRAVGFA